MLNRRPKYVLVFTVEILICSILSCSIIFNYVQPLVFCHLWCFNFVNFLGDIFYSDLMSHYSDLPCSVLCHCKVLFDIILLSSNHILFCLVWLFYIHCILFCYYCSIWFYSLLSFYFFSIVLFSFVISAFGFISSVLSFCSVLWSVFFCSIQCFISVVLFHLYCHSILFSILPFSIILSYYIILYYHSVLTFSILHWFSIPYYIILILSFYFVVMFFVLICHFIFYSVLLFYQY